MSFYRRVGVLVGNKAAAVNVIHNALIAAGWTLYDDQSVSSYKVYASAGDETGVNVPSAACYVHVSWSSANYISFTNYGWWNSSTHVGIMMLGSNSNVAVVDSGPFYISVFVDKCFFGFYAKVNTSYTMWLTSMYVPVFEDEPFATLAQAATNDATDQVIYLNESGQA